MRMKNVSERRYDRVSNREFFFAVLGSAGATIGSIITSSSLGAELFTFLMMVLMAAGMTMFKMTVFMPAKKSGTISWGSESDDDKR